MRESVTADAGPVPAAARRTNAAARRPIANAVAASPRLPVDHLFLPQGGHGVDSGGTARGDPAGDPRGQRDQAGSNP